ncbi:DNA repair protein RecO [Aliiglaciecola litoralis]|uniref:DNA repair protein RecO n=2 Tax=Aliiglaciecola litoralis TaxID=582857 RepID=A0ABP3WR36_9ALTE
MIVDFFTRDNGRLSAVCRGVRGGKSAKSNERKSAIQPFQTLKLSFSGRSELKTLTQIETLGRGYNLHGTVLFCALYINELINRVVPNEVAYPEIFDLYLASLLRLSEQDNVEIVLREFEITLLQLLGYGFDWQSDGQTGEPLQADAYYSFVLDYGFQRLLGQEAHQNCFTGANLADIARFHWTPSSLQTAKRVTRMAFRPIIGDKPLKSRELFQKLEQKK